MGEAEKLCVTNEQNKTLFEWSSRDEAQQKDERSKDIRKFLTNKNRVMNQDNRTIWTSFRGTDESNLFNTRLSLLLCLQCNSMEICPMKWVQFGLIWSSVASHRDMMD